MGVSRALCSESDHLRDLSLAHPAARVPPFPGSWGPLGASWLPTERTDGPQEHGHLWADQGWDRLQDGLRVPGNTSAWSSSPLLLHPGDTGTGEICPLPGWPRCLGRSKCSYRPGADGDDIRPLTAPSLSSSTTPTSLG